MPTPLTWVHGIELLDPTPYLSGGELVLTTGQRLPAEHDECRAYVQRLAAHDVGALGFGVGVGHDTVPDAVALACVEFGLPLLVVPEPTPFVSIVRVGADHVAEAERRALRHTVEFQRRLTRVALRDGAEAVVSAARTFLERPVVVLTADGAAVGEGPVVDELFHLQAAGASRVVVVCSAPTTWRCTPSSVRPTSTDGWPRRRRRRSGPRSGSRSNTSSRACRCSWKRRNG
ncbi:PucR family transcriptional regulator ligand-binding domain-containing protein [Dermacoccus sp. PAMC28757]|nr:PucR family transcriptional regulator ligand-binding domain-containing protein [Dermacoccus sp. PAMC28757]